MHSLLLFTGPHFGEARDKDLFDIKIRRDQPGTDINSTYKLMKMLNSCLKLCYENAYQELIWRVWTSRSGLSVFSFKKANINE